MPYLTRKASIYQFHPFHHPNNNRRGRQSMPIFFRPPTRAQSVCHRPHHNTEEVDLMDSDDLLKPELMMFPPPQIQSPPMTHPCWILWSLSCFLWSFWGFHTEFSELIAGLYVIKVQNLFKIQLVPCSSCVPNSGSLCLSPPGILKHAARSPSSSVCVFVCPSLRHFPFSPQNSPLPFDGLRRISFSTPI